MRLFWRVLLILLVVVPQFVWAITPLQSEKKVEIMFNSVYMIEDTAQSLNDIIHKKQQSFKLFTGKIEPYKSYWLRLQISNQTATPNWLFLFDAVKYAQIFDPQSPSKYICTEYGYSIPDIQKSFSVPFHEAIPFSLTQNKQKTIYLHIITDVEVYHNQCHLSVVGQQQFLDGQTYTNLLYGLFYGLLLMLFLVSISLAVGLYDGALAFYAFFVGGFAFFLFTIQGFTGCYLFPWLGNVELWAPIIGFIAITFYLQFFKQFIDLKKNKPTLNKYVCIWIYVSLLVIVVLSILMFFNTKAFFILQRVFIIVNQLITVIFLVLVSKNNNRLIRIFLIGSMGLLLGSVIYTTGNILGFSNKQMLPCLQWGFLLQVICFAGGLLYRYRLLIAAKNDIQQALIEELLEKDVQQLQQNAHLEEMVSVRTQELELRNKQLGSINLKHTEGIRAAATLQRNLFPSRESLERRFAGSFVWWQPQQEIGGDFYWFHETQRGQMLVVVADCTGHGVPGAITAIMGRDFLEDVVIKQNEIWPDKILQLMNKRFIERFSKQPDGEVRFGMDISIVLFDRQTRRAWFSGARQHLLIARNNEVERVRGELFGIGDNAQLRQYTLHDFTLSPADTFYLYTDGFQHQLRESTLKKYGSKHLRQFLQTIMHLPLPEQKKLFEAEWLRWRELNGDQTDDILIVGCMLLRGKTE